ncbi:MAG: flagellar biosynthetic protein FliO [Micavibrio sp.]|nr:flagellar biosynthetic protein FliO [Micavibrio sp.]HCK32498.1 flagellar biosynthetic protein FliO [Rhodospirillaceae bacterium]
MDILLMIAALIFVLALMLGLAWGVQRLGLTNGQNFLNPHPAKNMQIIEQLSVDHKRRLILVEVGKKKHLILTGPHGDTLIDNDVAIKAKKATIKS